MVDADIEKALQLLCEIAGSEQNNPNTALCLGAIKAYQTLRDAQRQYEKE